MPTTDRVSHPPSSMTPRNHIALLGVFFPTAGVILNVVRSWDEIKDEGIVTWFYIYVCTGIQWCMTFAALGGPVFIVGHSLCIVILDFVPGLGATLWTIASTLLVALVLLDNKTPMHLRNFHFFSLLLSNYWVALLSSFNNEARAFFGRPKYHFVYGNMELGYATKSFFKIYEFDVFPEEGGACFRKLCVNASDFVNGRNLESFRDSFSRWERDARHFVSRLYKRRLLCFVGFIVEAVGVSVVVALIGYFYSSPEWSRSPTSLWSRGGSDYDRATATSNILASREILLQAFFSTAFNLSYFQIAISLLLSACSHYLWVMIRVQYTFSSDMERAAWILCRSLAHQHPQSDGENLGHDGEKRWKLAGEKHPMRALLLPALGIARDVDESLRCGRIVMKSEQSGVKYELSLAEEGKYICHEYARTGEREELVTPETPGELVQVQVEWIVM